MLTASQTSPYLNRTVLQRTIKYLPKLRGLHVIGCLGVTHVDILSVTEYIPHLESLAITVMEPVSSLFRLVVNPSILGVVSSSVKHCELHLQVVHACVIRWQSL